MKINGYCLLIGILIIILITGCTNIQVGSPGSSQEVITVGATTQNDTIADFSSRGPTIDKITKPDVVAPGVDIIGAKASGTDMGDYDVGNYYTVASGTSMSTPIVAGSAALLIQAYKEKFGRKPTPAEIKAALMLGADRIKDKFGEEYDPFHQGTGRLNLSNSYEILMNKTPLLAVNPPKWSVSKPTNEMSRYTGRSEPMLVYAILPGDSAERKFTLIIGQDFSNLNVNPTGFIKDWIEIKSNRSYSKINGNRYETIVAEISVPEKIDGGRYSGAIEISNETAKLLEIPVDVLIPKNTEFSNGNIFVERNITINDTAYVSFSVPQSTHSRLKINTIWNAKGSENFANYLVDPNGLVNYLSYSYGDDYNDFESKASLIAKSVFRGNYTLVLWSPKQTVRANISLFALNIIPPYKEISIRENEEKNDTIMITNLGRDLNNVQIFGYREKERVNILKDPYQNASSLNHTFHIDSKTQKFLLNINITSANPGCYVSGKLYNPSDAIVDSFYWGGCNTTEKMSVKLPDIGDWRLSLITRNQSYFTSNQSDKIDVEIENSIYSYEEYGSMKFSQKNANLTTNSSLSIDYIAEYNKNLSGRNINAFIGLFSDEERISIPISIVQPINLSSISSIKPSKDGWLTGDVNIPEGHWILRFIVNSSSPSILQFIGQGGAESAFSDGDGSYIEVLLKYNTTSYTYMGKIGDITILFDYLYDTLSFDMNGDGKFSGIYEESFLEDEILDISGNLYKIEGMDYGEYNENMTLGLYKFSRDQEFNLNVTGGKNWEIKVIGKEFPGPIDINKIELSNSTYNEKKGTIKIDKQNILKFYIIAYNPASSTVYPSLILGDYYIYPYIQGNDVYKEEIPISYLSDNMEIIVIPDYDYYYGYQYPKLYYKAVYSKDEIDANISYTLISRDKPDLAITSKDIMFSNYSPMAGENLTINATIGNMGLRNASNILVQFFDGNPGKNGTHIADKIIEKINSGENSTVSAVWNSTGGNHNIHVIIDPENEIDELDKANNQAYRSIYVKYKECPLKGDTPPCDGKLNDFELLDYVNSWNLGEVGDFALLEAVNNWADK